jgi:hypothetical protein
MAEQIRAMLASKIDNEPAQGRRLYLLSPIVFPIDQNWGARRVLSTRNRNPRRVDHWRLAGDLQQAINASTDARQPAIEARPRIGAAPDSQAQPCCMRPHFP